MIRLLGDVEEIDIDAGHNVMMSRPVEIASIVPRTALLAGLITQAGVITQVE